MYTKDFTSYKSSYRKCVKDIYKCLPDLGVASALALIIKAIHCWEKGKETAVC
jgi:hypothetical protein